MSATGTILLSNTELTRFLFAIILLLIFAHSFGYLFQRFKMPKVIGEIIGGILLGPTFLGYFFPEAYDWIFSAFSSEGKLLAVIYWLGLLLLMFMSGFEIQKSINRDDRKTIFAILIGATIIPFIAGFFSPMFYDFSPFLGAKGNMLALSIIIAIAVAVTAIPIISKIFIELGIMNTRFAKIVIAIATIEDIILWVMLAIATALVGTEEVSALKIISTVAITLMFFGISLILMPRIIRFSNSLRINLLIKSSLSGYALIICFLFTALASILNINVVFGAFLAGIIIGTMPNEKFGDIKAHIKEVSLAFFIPIYLAIVGLKIDLIHSFDIMFFFGFLLFSTLIKVLGTIITARIIKKDWLSSLNLGIVMSARGTIGIILATVAFDAGIINQEFFVVLVMIAIVTTLFAGYWLKFVMSKGWALMKEESSKDIL